jgi:hypothetical protein
MHGCGLQQTCIFICFGGAFFYIGDFLLKQVLEAFYDQTLEPQSAKWEHHERLQLDY